MRYVINADVLISLHGAGLTHILWMRPQGKVLEIRAREDAHNNCYYSLASDIGHEYHYALAEKKDPTKPTQLTDFMVCKQHLRERVSNMMKYSPNL